MRTSAFPEVMGHWPEPKPEKPKPTKFASTTVRRIGWQGAMDIRDKWMNGAKRDDLKKEYGVNGEFIKAVLDWEIFRTDGTELVRQANGMMMPVETERAKQLVKEGLHPDGKPLKLVKSPLNEKMVREIRRMWAEKKTMGQISEVVGLTSFLVGRVVRRQTWAWID